jgi:hypothetical protein
MLKAFLSGAITMACMAIGLFFVRFWRRTGDRFFLMFAGAFWLLMVERIILLSVSASTEFAPYTYLVRLSAFLLISIAIIDKNRQIR